MAISQIKTQSITPGSTITGNLLASNIIRSNNIVVGQITGNLIGTGAITGNLIGTGAISSNHFSTGVTLNLANANTTIINVQNQLAVYGFAFQNIMTLTDATTITMNLAQTNNFTVTLGGNRTLANATNFNAGQSGFLVIRQDGTGSRTLAYGTGWRFPSNAAPSLTTTASAVDLLVYSSRDSGNLVAQLIPNVT
tara:strand:+ start:151 stop:735 length:585 start_codon:yes stop_codon:yes gene_type:complete